MAMNEQDLLLDDCKACEARNCEECVHLTVGAFCPHCCWWLLHANDCKGSK